MVGFPLYTVCYTLSNVIQILCDVMNTLHNVIKILSDSHKYIDECHEDRVRDYDYIV